MIKKIKNQNILYIFLTISLIFNLYFLLINSDSKGVYTNTKKDDLNNSTEKMPSIPLGDLQKEIVERIKNGDRYKNDYAEAQSRYPESYFDFNDWRFSTNGIWLVGHISYMNYKKDGSPAHSGGDGSPISGSEDFIAIFNKETKEWDIFLRYTDNPEVWNKVLDNSPENVIPADQRKYSRAPIR